jgi:hypothetical protein
MELLKVRNNNEKLNFDNGPYHIEAFPYLYYSPEEILLNEEEKRKYLNSKSLTEDIENLIVELKLMSV